jgi:16S rRNA (uracil1498-N3)-methyltransferase
MNDVLRLRKGEKVVIFDGSGSELVVELTLVSKGKVEWKVFEEKQNESESKIKINLYQALPKNPEKFEMVLQKGTEVGVVRFVPLITARTERQSLNKVERLGRILKEAAEQSGRGIVPELCEIVEFGKVLKNVPEGLNVLAHLTGEKSLKKVCENLGGIVNIFIGPEGGFTENEVSDAAKAGFEIVSLGKRILRAETAGVIMAGFIGLVTD